MGYARPGCRISSGEITFDGQNFLSLPEAERARLRGVKISYVAQSAAASFNPAHRLIDQYAEVALAHRVMSGVQAKHGAVDLYRRLRLPDPETFGDRFPHQVSGGQLQRAMIAMAMACRPDLIIFDEPTTALDVTTQIEVLVAIKDIVRDFHVAAIYITHDLAVVAQLADRIMVLRYGNLVEQGTTREILFSPQQEYTRRLLGASALTKIETADRDVILHVRGICADYRSMSNVLTDVTLQVPRGRTVAIVGESGSGKSTLARVITGLLPPRKGEVSFRGEMLPGSLARRSKDSLRRLQMIYQMPDVALNPRHRVREILGRPLTFYLGLKGSHRERRIRELLQMIELGSDFADRYPAELSGGQKQRVCIARALAADPDLIICDEVTSSLDQLVAQGILHCC